MKSSRGTAQGRVREGCWEQRTSDEQARGWDVSRDSTRQVWAQQEVRCTFCGETGAHYWAQTDTVTSTCRQKKCFPNRILKEDQTDVLEESAEAVWEKGLEWEGQRHGDLLETTEIIERLLRSWPREMEMDREGQIKNTAYLTWQQTR